MRSHRPQGGRPRRESGLQLLHYDPNLRPLCTYPTSLAKHAGLLCCVGAGRGGKHSHVRFSVLLWTTTTFDDHHCESAMILKEISVGRNVSADKGELEFCWKTQRVNIMMAGVSVKKIWRRRSGIRPQGDEFYWKRRSKRREKGRYTHTSGLTFNSLNNKRYFFLRFSEWGTGERTANVLHTTNKSAPPSVPPQLQKRRATNIRKLGRTRARKKKKKKKQNKQKQSAWLKTKRHLL